MLTNWKKAAFTVLATVIITTLVLTACSPNDIAHGNAINANQSYAPYAIKNFIEQKYYSWRLQMSDDPSLIVWCTIFPATPGVKPVTLPIVGKLVSSSKRPFAGDPATGGSVDDQAMYGNSVPYRYGFGPNGMQEYYDITDLPTLCTTMPMVWQTQLTVMVQSKDNALLTASQQAHDLIAQGKGAQAEQILNAAMQAAQGGQ